MSVASFGRLQEPFRKSKMVSAKLFRNTELYSQGYEVGFHLEVPSSLFAAWFVHHQKEKHLTVQKCCGITSQQKGDFAALCKMLPSARSDWLAMAVTSSFQLRIVHRLKHWIVDFLSFEMVYRLINWTSESAPKVAATTVIKNMLHGRFSLLFLLAIRVYSWQMTSKLCPRFLIALLSLDLLW